MANNGATYPEPGGGGVPQRNFPPRRELLPGGRSTGDGRGEGRVACRPRPGAAGPVACRMPATFGGPVEGPREGGPLRGRSHWPQCQQLQYMQMNHSTWTFLSTFPPERTRYRTDKPPSVSFPFAPRGDQPLDANSAAPAAFSCQPQQSPRMEDHQLWGLRCPSL